MTSIYDNTVCEVKIQMPIPGNPFPRSSRRGNYRVRTKAHPFRHTDWEELLKREWNKRAPPLSPLEWREKHARNTNAEDYCEFLMGRRCGRRRRLLFRSGYYLTIQPDGSVKGTKQKDCPYAIVEICSVGAGLVKIAGVETEFFLTIDDSGTLRATDADSEECVFEEVMVKDFYSAYKSYAYSNEHWTVAINDKDGRAYSARCQGLIDSDLEAHSLPEMMPDSDASSDEESTTETRTSREVDSDTSRFIGLDASRFLEHQTSRLFDLLNFDLEACLMAELQEDEGHTVVFPDNDADIGPSLSEILRELGTSL